MQLRLYHSDCLDVLPNIPSQSVDAVITDPPYPMIKRKYGMLTVDEWWDLMMVVCAETRRILKPTGSAVFILQPNSEHVGQMRGWLWEFMAWVCREWNMVQDVWWWNYTALPTAHATHGGLTKPSIKSCVWCGSPKCYRDQTSVLWDESQANAIKRASGRFERRAVRPSGYRPGKPRFIDGERMRTAAIRNGGVAPFNMLPISTANSTSSAGAKGHGAGTPLKLADWWTRYICPPGGTACDPFMGSGTMGLAALQNGCGFVGVEKFPVPERDVNPKDNPDYFSIARRRIEEKQSEMIQPELDTWLDHYEDW